MNKEYEITLKFKISGDMDNRITEKHIKDNMIDEIESAIEEFEVRVLPIKNRSTSSTMSLDGDIEVVALNELVPVVIESRITKPTSLNERQNAVSMIDKYLITIEKAKP